VRYKRKHGTGRTLIPAAAGLALYPALLALVRVPYAVLPVIAFRGLAGAGINLAFFDTLLETIPRDREARYVAINNTIVHLSGVIGPPIGAAMLSFMSIRLALVFGTVVSLLGVAVFGFVRRTRDKPVAKNDTDSEE
jgi:MFS family permease